jgi:hypothetical protein
VVRGEREIHAAQVGKAAKIHGAKYGKTARLKWVIPVTKYRDFCNQVLKRAKCPMTKFCTRRIILFFLSPESLLLIIQRVPLGNTKGHFA